MAMRLSGFILENIEAIVREWTDFARTLSALGEPLDTTELRDHAEQMLRAIATDLQTDQSSQQQVDKSQGHGVSNEQTAAKSHAITRLMSGFTIDQVVSEFRALRASVIKQWMSRETQDAQQQIEDMIRFNEAIDQALAESITSYTGAVQASRNIFLGILGHDLRTPLSAILLGADVLLRTHDLGARPTKVASRIYSSVKRANQIVGDLLDFTRSQIGPGIPLKKTEVDMQPICTRIVEESSTVHPEADIRLTSDDPVIGRFDGDRLEQVFSNLIGNAIQHGNSSDPVEVTLTVSESELRFTVHNTGSPIPEDVLPFIFNPMDRYSPEKMTDNGPYSSLGLGLFIVDRIVDAHGGRIEVTSKADLGTTFVVVIPLNAE
ncbi:Two-component sensor histidine kinase [Pseudomonas syringae pv. atrofaciens]|uniref:histidine kinase n=2 Tax=Pseudomonas syringae TaxID=317 RepID=A0AAD0MVD5_PSESX|nr:two-component sensor histidine kinase [Pseudomonas syringae pv. atrofaciens]KPW09248.1 Two-component sensor histidine kinase [Pseudomonas syringae pv. atrofaciens]